MANNISLRSLVLLKTKNMLLDVGGVRRNTIFFLPPTQSAGSLKGLSLVRCGTHNMFGLVARD